MEKIRRVFFAEFTFDVFAHEVDGGLGVNLMTPIYGYGENYKERESYC